VANPASVAKVDRFSSVGFSATQFVPGAWQDPGRFETTSGAAKSAFAVPRESWRSPRKIGGAMDEATVIHVLTCFVGAGPQNRSGYSNYSNRDIPSWNSWNIARSVDADNRERAFGSDCRRFCDSGVGEVDHERDRRGWCSSGAPAMQSTLNEQDTVAPLVGDRRRP